MSLDHVVTTRFSVTFVPGQEHADDDWLRYRLGFFAEATCPSIASQTAPVDWLVFLDDRAPQWLREQMDLLGEGLFTPVYIAGPWGPAVVQREVGARFSAPRLITTRLDSDDALGTRFAETVQREAADRDDLYVNCLRGLQVDRSGQIYRYDYPVNPFISYVERRTEAAPYTVWRHVQHPQSRRFAPVVEVVTEPLWLQVVHGGNVLNDVTGVRVDPVAVERGFEIELGYDEAPGRLRIAAQALLSRVRRLRGWLRHPGLLRRYAAGRLSYLRGTRVLPQVEPTARGHVSDRSTGRAPTPP